MLMKQIKSLSFRIIILSSLWVLMWGYVNFNFGDSPAETHFGKRWWNTEASLHFLNTLGRYHYQSIDQHWFAIGAPCTEVPKKPCIKHALANQPLSALLTSDRLGGEVVYTSFPPGAMIISSAVVFPLAQLFDMAALDSLRIWNWSLALITAMIFSIALNRMLTRDLRYRDLLIVLASFPLLIAVEPLHAHHLSLWAHQVYQPFLAGMLVLLSEPITRKRSLVLGLFCALGCWIEWTAYLLCIAIFLVVWHLSDKQERIKNVVVFSSSAIAGGISLLAYYAWLVGLEPYFEALSGRFSERNFTNEKYHLIDWLYSLAQSFGPWLAAVIILAVAASLVPGKTHQKESLSRQKNIWCAEIFVIIFILLENVLLFEHSIIYTFDRLKWGFLLGLVFALSGERLILRLNSKGLGLVVIAALIASVASLNLLISQYPSFL